MLPKAQEAANSSPKQRMQRATEPMVIATATAHLSPWVARATLKAQRAARNVSAISDRMEKRGKIKVEPSSFGALASVWSAAVLSWLLIAVTLAFDGC
jgi:hypothetical protein